MSIEEQLEKLLFQMKLVGESLDSREYPIPALVISMNWSATDLDKAHDIFEKFNGILESGKKPSWGEFEKDFEEQLKIDYQSLKTVVLAFYRNFQWTQVCEIYARARECLEFHEITRQKSF